MLAQDPIEPLNPKVGDFMPPQGTGMHPALNPDLYQISYDFLGKSEFKVALNQEGKKLCTANFELTHVYMEEYLAEKGFQGTVSIEHLGCLQDQFSRGTISMKTFGVIPYKYKPIHGNFP